MFTELCDLSSLLLHPGNQTLQFSLKIRLLLAMLGRLYLMDQLLMLTDKFNTQTQIIKKWKKKRKRIEIKLTHKLICPSSSCRAKSSSESEPSGCSACIGSPSVSGDVVEDETKSLWRLFLAPQPDLCSVLTRSHSCGWWCFIMWRILCTLAWTEWLGLVDCDRKKIQRNYKK